DPTVVTRTADGDAAGRRRMEVGATLVRHSDPNSEAAETRAKAATLLAAFGLDQPGSGAGPAAAEPVAAGGADGGGPAGGGVAGGRGHPHRPHASLRLAAGPHPRAPWAPATRRAPPAATE